MAKNTSIEWTDHTFNPWWGCFKVSAGCANCYADTWAKRYGHNVWGPATTTDRRMFGDKHWAEPHKWNKQAKAEGIRRRVFCASMADVFESHPQLVEPRKRLFELILDTPSLDWLLLTKRPENIKFMLQAMPVLKRDNVWDHLWPLPNVWIGTSVENQEQADKRIPELLKVPAVTRFLSCEPLLEKVCLQDYLDCRWEPEIYDPVTGRNGSFAVASSQIHWVIAGGESGPKARQMEADWARSLRDQCTASKVAFFFKQWGGKNKKTTGRMLDGRTWDEMPKSE